MHGDSLHSFTKVNPNAFRDRPRPLRCPLTLCPLNHATRPHELHAHAGAALCTRASERNAANMRARTHIITCVTCARLRRHLQNGPGIVWAGHFNTAHDEGHDEREVAAGGNDLERGGDELQNENTNDLEDV